MEVTPHLLLKDIDSMHNFLQKRLDTIVDVSDLVPFIKHLLPINNLKAQLSSLLYQQYEAQTTKHDSECAHNYSVRSLFLSLCTLNGIPSDDIHAKIISYLEPSEYRKIPMLSKHFRNIMRNYPNIYNEARYSMHLNLQTTVNSNTYEFDLNHKQCTFEVNAVIDHKQDHDALHLLQQEQNMDFPFQSLQFWHFCSSAWSWNNDNNCIKSNQLILSDIVTKSIASIRGVRFDNMRHTFIAQEFMDQHIIFKQCITAKLYDSLLLPSLFHQLQYLELMNPSFSSHDGEDADSFTAIKQLVDSDTCGLKAQEPLITLDRMNKFYAAIHDTLHHCKCINIALNGNCRNTLRGFVYRVSETSVLKQYTFDAAKYCGALNIPSNVEWLSFKNIDAVIDLRGCNDIIGVELSQDIKYNQVLWPQHNDADIPYLYLSPVDTSASSWNAATGIVSQWKKYLYKYKYCVLPPVRFVCFGAIKPYNSDSWSWLNADNEVYDEDQYRDSNDEDEKKETDEAFQKVKKNVERVTIAEVGVNAKYKEERCLLLNKCEINKNLLRKLLVYKFGKETAIIEDKLSMYERWWNLQTATWILQIGNLSKWKDA